jgi:hypothetical protein
MNMKKIILATASYVVITMAVAYPWHMIWFHDLYEEMGAYTRPEPSIPLGMLAMITQGTAIASLYPSYYKGGSPPILQGIKFSLIMGTLVYSVMGFAMAAKIDINPITTFLFYGAVFQLIQFVLTGAVLGLIYGKINQPTY